MFIEFKEFDIWKVFVLCQAGNSIPWNEQVLLLVKKYCDIVIFLKMFSSLGYFEPTGIEKWLNTKPSINLWAQETNKTQFLFC